MGGVAAKTVEKRGQGEKKGLMRASREHSVVRRPALGSATMKGWEY
jgi:hypothetical protein